MATIIAAAGGGNWSNTATWVGAVVPTAADDVQLTNTSGNVTITAGAVARSLDCTGYTGTLAHTAGVTLTLGDGAAGASNIALKLVAGMTYTLADAATSAISFVSTSATQQTITTGGKNLGSWTVNGAGSSYLLSDSNTTGTTAAVTLTTGTLDTNSQTCSWGSLVTSSGSARTLSLGASAITLKNGGNALTASTAGMTVTTNTATVTITGGSAAITNGAVDWKGMSAVFSGSGTATVGTGTFANITRTGTAAKTDTLSISGNPTITGNFTVNGNSATSRMHLTSSVTGTTRTISCGGTVSMSYVDMTDITGAGTASWNLSSITGGCGDCGGNAGITFTASAAQTWQGTASGSWSDNTKWTSRVPLPQDDVLISASFAASQTVTMDMPRLGRNIDFTGVSGNVTLASAGGFALFMYGSLTLAPTMTYSLGAGLTLAGRNAAFTVTTAGRTFITNVNVQANGGSYTLQDDFTSTVGLALIGGTLNTNDKTVTVATLSAGNVGSVLNVGNSTLNLTSTATNANLLVRTNSAAMTAGAATINVVNAATGRRCIGVSAVNLSQATINYTVAGSTGDLALTGTFQLGTLNFYDTNNSRSLYLQLSNTVTVTNFNVYGSAGKLVTLAACDASGAPVAGTAVTLSKPYGYVSCDYLSIQDIAATGGASWYAGSNSLSISNVSGWFFQAYSPSKFLELI